MREAEAQRGKGEGSKAYSIYKEKKTATADDPRRRAAKEKNRGSGA